MSIYIPFTQQYYLLIEFQYLAMNYEQLLKKHDGSWEPVLAGKWVPIQMTELSISVHFHSPDDTPFGHPDDYSFT